MLTVNAYDENSVGADCLNGKRCSALSLLQGHQVREVHLTESSADVVLEFDHGQRLEILTDSSGFEPWNLHAPGVHLVALGGGGVADYSPRS